MAIISFAYTEKEYRAGIKTVTRRDWKPSYMERWQKWYDEGNRVHEAWTKVPFAGGRPMGHFRLTERPYWEALEDMPEEDLEKEGGMCDTLDEFYELIGLPPEHEVAVVRFEKISDPEPTLFTDAERDA